MTQFHSSLWLSNIPLYICTTSSQNYLFLKSFLLWKKKTLKCGKDNNSTMYSSPSFKNYQIRASLVAQWLRICLPMQGTLVRALVWEDPTCRGATRPVHHNYWACASGACALQQERPRPVKGLRTAMKSGPPCSLQLEKVRAQKWRPNTTKNK